jgi:hypothetical protein
MDYNINITKIRKEDFSTVVVWLSEASEDSLSRINTYDLTYAVICYKEYTSHNLHLYEGDQEMVSQKLINQFKANFSIVTDNILQATSYATMLEMSDTVELFIREYVYKVREELGYI